MLLQYGLYEFPILEDRAYFVYLGQAVLRGESIYADDFAQLAGGEERWVGYPPLAPLLSAASVRSSDRWNEIDGDDGLHFCGAYWGYGFHEDGASSGLRAARAIGGSA